MLVFPKSPLPVTLTVAMWRVLRSLFAKLRGNSADSEQPVLTPLGNATAGKPTIRIVGLLASEQDRQLLSRLAPQQGWAVHFADTCGEAWEVLKQQKVPIVLCDRDFPGAEWRDVIQMMSSSPDLVYAILLSRVADDYLWNEVIRHGGYDVLSTPLREEEVLRAIRLGWSYWSSSTRSLAR